MSQGRRCLTQHIASLAGQTLSDPAHSLSGRSDTPVRPAGWLAHTLSDPVHNLSDPTKTCQIVTVPRKVDACAILPQPSFGDPRGLESKSRWGIP